MPSSTSTQFFARSEREHSYSTSHVVVNGDHHVTRFGQMALDEMLEWFSDLQNDIEDELREMRFVDEVAEESLRTSSYQTLQLLPSTDDDNHRASLAMSYSNDDVNCSRRDVTHQRETTDVIVPEGVLFNRRNSYQQQPTSYSQSSAEEFHRRRHRFEQRRAVKQTTYVRSNSYQGDERSAVMSLAECHVVERRGEAGGISVLDRVTLTEQVWHFGSVSRAAAIYILQNRPDGAFVVRCMTTGDAEYMTSSSDRLLYVRQGERVVQFAILVTSLGRWCLLDSERTFSSLAEMITYYCQERSSGLRLTLPSEILQATTLDQLKHIAKKQAEFWISDLSSSSSALSDKPTQLSLPDPEGGAAVGRHDHQPDENYDDVDHRRHSQRWRTAKERNGEVAVRAGSKLSDYEDLWLTPTPDTFIKTPSNRAAFLDPTKYQLSDASHQTAARRQHRMMSKTSGGAATLDEGDSFATTGQNQDVSGRANGEWKPVNATRTKQSAFEFDEDAAAELRFAGSVELTGSVGPSPVYAEPWDALVTSNDVQRSVGVSNTGHPIFRRNNGGRSRRLHKNEGKTDDRRDRKAVISSGYRIPADALRFDADSPADAKRPTMPPLPPPPPVPPSRSDELRVTKYCGDAVVTSADAIDEPLMMSNKPVPLKRGSAKGRVANEELTKFFVSTQRSVGVENIVSKATTSPSSAFPLVNVTTVCVDEMRPAAWRSPDRQHGYRSDYDNMSEDDVSKEMSVYDDSGDEFPVARSRVMTGSSMRTEYSSPWDGSKWHQLFAVNDGNNNDKFAFDDYDQRRTQSPPEEWRQWSNENDVTGSNRGVENALTPTTPTMSKYDPMLANSNLTYCDRSHSSTLTRFSSSAAALDDLDPGVVSGDCASAEVQSLSASSPVRRLSAVTRDSGTRDRRAVGRNPVVTSGTLDRRQDLPSVIESNATGSPFGSTTTTTATATRPPRYPVSRRASAMLPATVGSSVLARGFSTPSSTMSRTTAGDEWLSQKSPDVIPLIATPRLVSPRYRGHFHPAAQISDFIVRLTRGKQDSKLGTLVHNFIQCTVNGRETNPRKVVSNVRQFMNGMKNFLSFKGEPELDKFINSIRSEMKPSECLNLDAVIEMALIKCTIKPLKEHIYRLFEYEYTRNGSLQMLSEGLKALRTAGLSLSPEVVSSIDEVSLFLTLMEKSYSPLTKLENLLSALATLGESIKRESSEAFPIRAKSSPVTADELLSSTVAVLVKRNMMSAEIEADYMWALIHPSFLTGDARYQLTTFSSAVNQLKNFRKLAEPRTTSLFIGSIDATLATSSGGGDGFVTVTTVDECNDIVVRHSLPVFPEMAAKDICCLLAHRLRITNPQDYGLYTLCSGSDKRMSEDEKIQPQSCKSIKSTKRGNKFVYKRLETHFVWPQCMINGD